MVIVALVAALLIVNFLIPNLPECLRNSAQTCLFSPKYWSPLPIFIGLLVGFACRDRRVFLWLSTLDKNRGRQVDLGSKNANPIVGSLFELIILSRFVRNFAMMLKQACHHVGAGRVPGEPQTTST